MIHYVGQLATEFGTRACGEADEADADSYDLGSTDCLPCKMTLLNVEIVHAQPGSVPVRVVKVEPFRLAVQVMPGMRPNPMVWRQLDAPNFWSRVEQPELEQPDGPEQESEQQP